MILNKEKEFWHYFALLHEITLKHKSDSYCSNCLHFFRAEKKLKFHENVCKNKKRFCRILMLSEKYNIITFNQHMKSDKMPYIILLALKF